MHVNGNLHHTSLRLFHVEQMAQQKRSFNYLLQCPHILVQGIIVNIMFLLTVLKEGARDSSLSFTDDAHPTNPLFISQTSSTGDI
jgi:hypothetical protein